MPTTAPGAPGPGTRPVRPRRIGSLNAQLLRHRCSIGAAMTTPMFHRCGPNLPRRGLPGEPARGRRVRVVVDVLLLLVLVQARRAELAADAGPAEPAPLRLRQVGVVVVDPHRAVPPRAGDP